jgi:hypothetical protein
MVQVRRATARTLLVIATAAGLVLAGTAGAAVSDVVTDVEPTGDETSYPPPEKPTISVDVEAICPEGVPTIDYAVTVTGTDADTTNITVDAPTGDDVVLTGRPLTGQIPWTGPLAVVDVTFAVGKTEVTVPVDLNVCPPEKAPTPSPTVPTADDLPPTGLEAFPLLASALGLVLVGGAAVTLAVVRRRRVGSDE